MLLWCYDVMQLRDWNILCTFLFLVKYVVNRVVCGTENRVENSVMCYVFVHKSRSLFADRIQRQVGLVVWLSAIWLWL